MRRRQFIALIDWLTPSLLAAYHFTSGNSAIERLQAARHSTLLMCVAASQKPMQSASDLPPPPGLLAADSLGLPLPAEAPGERASEEPPEEPPPVANWLGKGSDMGDSGATVDPSCAVVGVVGVVVVGTPADGVGPAEGAGDAGDNGVGANRVSPAEGDVDGAAVVVGAESLGLGAATDVAPADERACANAASGSSSKKAMAARTGGLGVTIAITRALPALQVG
jgi:hypothetical protein